MKVGVPTEIKTDEYRVSLTPAGVRELVEHDHDVIIQSGAGVGSTIPDEEYTAQGARIAPDAAAVFEEAEMVLGVKEPQPDEVAMLRPDHLLFTYLHLAPAPDLTKGLVESGATCVAYETVVDDQGRLPLLAPMSEVAGKIATQAGAFFLERPLGGRGVLLGGVPGVAAATGVIMGGGGDDHRRRRGRPERGLHRDRHGGGRVRVRPQHRPPARARRGVRRPRLDGVQLDARDRGDAAAGRPRDRRGADPRRPRAVRDHAGAAAADEAQRRPGGRL